MSEYVYAGLTSQHIDIFVADSSSTVGAGLSGLVYNSAGLVASYRKGQTGSRTAITLATQTVGGAYSSGGFVEIDATHMKGIYRLDLPDAAVDTEGFVSLYLYGATNMVPVRLRIDCRALPVDLKKIGADAQSMTDLKDFADAGYDPATNKLTGAVELDSASLIRFVTEDTGETAAANGSVAKLSQGSDGSGTGARTVTITVNDGTSTLQNAVVRLTEGVNTYTATTNASGIATLNVDDATYVVSISKPGYSFAGTTIIVDGTETRTYSMTAIVVTPAVAPLCNVAIHVQDQYGNDLVGEPVEITFIEFTVDAAETPPVLSVPPVQESDANGLVEVTLYRDARYKIVYGTSPYARRIDITVPDAGSYEVSQ